ncbi:MAG: substrate-binding domain-containing protein [Phycisphaerae bacterium]|jgi:simple sugar transport system substrate-binding protein|nr:substrate-binding domain-containing protein [Phycisphaerae bacterium]
MRTLRAALLTIIVTVAVLSPHAASAAEPSRDDALGVLDELRLAGFDGVLAQFHRAPEWSFLRGRGQVIHLLKNGAFVPALLKELAGDGQWGRAEKLFGKERLRRRAVLHGVKPDDCYALMLKNGKAEAVFWWNGQRLLILHYSLPAARKPYEEYVRAASQRLMQRASGSDSKRGADCSGLGNMGPKAEDAIPAISKLLASDDQYSRVQAAIALWRIDRKSLVSVPPLIEALANATLDVKTRALAAEGLGIVGPRARSAELTMLAAVDEKAPILRVWAAWALWKTTGDPKPALPVMFELLKDPNPQVSDLAAKTLGEMGLDSKSLAGLRAVGFRAVTVGFSQIGSESKWRTANTLSIKSEARKRGVDLRVTDAQQKQENQIKALRAFIEQKVDIIVLAPVVVTGWASVFKEIKAAGIPVILTDRAVDVHDKSLYVTVLAADFVEEGRAAARWLVKNTKGDLRIFELCGTPGARVEIERRKGFEEIIAQHPRIRIIKSCSADFRSSRAKEVTEAFLTTSEAKKCNAIYAHNDGMALGAIQAIKAANLKPGKDIKIVSIDAVRDALKALLAGELNCSVECSPRIGPQLFDIIEAVLAARKLTAAAGHKLLKSDLAKALGGGVIEKRIAVKTRVFDQSITKEILKQRDY